jgi:predicted Zn-dependent protease
MHDFLERTSLRVLFDIPPALIDHARAMAYESHLAGRHDQAETLCRGLLAVDHRCWWTHALYAATLRDSGRLGEARAIAARGLRYQPDQPTLLAMLAELVEALRDQPPPAPPAALPEAA